ncbi:AAA family ATPase [Gaopeijia maritima]|uniref:AAA family ATPase n=1 Tax=Gaopeijia maritima TaxID=3119007 RepID=UPI003250F01B
MLRSMRVDLPSGAAGFPLGLPFLRELDLEFSESVTLLAGANGSGKSTLLEAIAIECGFPALGRAAPRDDPSLESIRPLARALQLSWDRRTRHGLFLRAEDVFGFILGLRTQREHLEAELRAAEVRLEGASEYARRLGLGPLRSSIGALVARYGENPDARSHGETFLHLFRERLTPGGLYLLDEPEAALSPESQLALVSMLSDAVGAGSQFVVATHSPLLLAIPGATLYEFDGDAVRRTAWDDLASVRLWQGVLGAPERYLRHLWSPGSAE